MKLCPTCISIASKGGCRGWGAPACLTKKGGLKCTNVQIFIFGWSALSPITGFRFTQRILLSDLLSPVWRGNIESLVHPLPPKIPGSTPDS